MSTPTDDQILRIGEAITQGRKIEAIKLYREFTDVGLKDAKVKVERMEKELREKFPERFTKTEKKGCAPGVLLLFILTIGLALLSTQTLQALL